MKAGINMKAWRKTTAVFSEDVLEFTPQSDFTFIRKQDKTYLLPLGLNQYVAVAKNSNPQTLANSMVCFNKGKFVVSIKDTAEALPAGYEDFKAILDNLSTTDDTISFKDFYKMIDSLVEININIPKDNNYIKKTTNPELNQVAETTFKFINHLVDSKIVAGLIDPAMTATVLKQYGEDKANDNVL